MMPTVRQSDEEEDPSGDEGGAVQEHTRISVNQAALLAAGESVSPRAADLGPVLNVAKFASTRKAKRGSVVEVDVFDEDQLIPGMITPMDSANELGIGIWAGDSDGSGDGESTSLSPTADGGANEAAGQTADRQTTADGSETAPASPVPVL
jgi:hypothetical protein